jgi:hypothetical protein
MFGWCWAAPLADGTVSVAVFLDPSRAIIKQQAGIERAFRSMLLDSKLLGVLASASVIGEIRGCDASRSACAEVVGKDSVRVGDASFTIDPLSSQGLLRAIVSGLQGAVAINTLLRRPEKTVHVEAFCLARQAEALAEDCSIASALYREQAAINPTAFWVARQGAEETEPPSGATNFHSELRLALSPDATMAPEPVIHRDIITPLTALHHPALRRPIAFVRDVPILTLFPHGRCAENVQQIFGLWSQLLSPSAARELMIRLFQKQVLIPCD